MITSKPTVHLNGSDAETLRDLYWDAAQTLRVALDELRAAAPHERDYYVQNSPTAYAAARAEHVERVLKLQNVLQDLEALEAHVQAQLNDRNRQRRSR